MTNNGYVLWYISKIMLNEIKNNINAQIVSWLEQNGVALPLVELAKTARFEFGDYTTSVAMRYAKELRRNPIELAEQLVEFLRDKDITGVEGVEAIKPGYINIRLAYGAKIRHFFAIPELGAEFGKNTLHQGEKWVIEHTSPNPNKALHIGHLRLNLVGMSIVRLIESSGATVTVDGVYNDRGIAIAKAMYGYLSFMKKDDSLPTDIDYWYHHQNEWFLPADKGIKPDVFVESGCYVRGEEAFLSSGEIEREVRQMVVDWEAGDEMVWALWRLVLGFVYEGHERVFARLHSRWDKIWYEHEHYKQGKAYVETGLQQGVFKKLDDGAVLTKLEAYGLPDTIVQKSDTTSLYITQDIALTDLKKRTYDADRLVWVIGPEQTLALKQLFAVCEQLGIGKLSDFTHVSYGKVSLKKEGGGFVKMSSRAGTVVWAEDVIDAVKEQVLTRLKNGTKYEVGSEELSEKLAIAAVKFSFLKLDKNQAMTFAVSQAIDVQGDSGMYVMYTYVRTQSILRKAKNTGVIDVESVLNTEAGLETELLRHLLFYEEIIQKAVTDLSVHHVAQYLLELCGLFNSWYAKEAILDGSDRVAYKVKIVEAVGIVIENGFSLMGIETVDEM